MDVSIVLLTYNSEDTVYECLENINLNIKNSKLLCEIIVVDANSNDNTIDIINQNSNAKIISIKEKNRSISFNKGVDISIGKYICRVDARSVLPNNYINLCFNFLENNKNYFNVGGKMVPYNSNAHIEILYTSIISFGTASFRISKIDRDVNSVYLGFFPKKTFLILGGYDEKNFFINEETDLNHRGKKHGYLIRLLASLKVTYITRNKFSDYLLTMKRYGAARGGFYLKHKMLNFRLVVFILYYLVFISQIFLSIYLKNIFYIYLIFFQFLALYLFFINNLKIIKYNLSLKIKLLIFTKIITGHFFWLYGFFLRLLSITKNFN